VNCAWHSIDTLLGLGCVPPLNDSCTEQFHRYFDDNVAGVRSATADATPPLFLWTYFDASFRQFHPVTVDQVTSVVRELPDKSCALHTLLTAHLKAVIGIIPPLLTELFNRSWRVVSSAKSLKLHHSAPEEVRHGSGRHAVVATGFQPVDHVQVTGATLGMEAIGLSQQV